MTARPGVLGDLAIQLELPAPPPGPGLDDAARAEALRAHRARELDAARWWHAARMFFDPDQPDPDAP